MVFESPPCICSANFNAVEVRLPARFAFVQSDTKNARVLGSVLLLPRVTASALISSFALFEKSVFKSKGSLLLSALQSCPIEASNAESRTNALAASTGLFDDLRNQAKP